MSLIHTSNMTFPTHENKELIFLITSTLIIIYSIFYYGSLILKKEIQIDKNYRFERIGTAILMAFMISNGWLIFFVMLTLYLIIFSSGTILKSTKSGYEFDGVEVDSLKSALVHSLNSLKCDFEMISNNEFRINFKSLVKSNDKEILLPVGQPIIEITKLKKISINQKSYTPLLNEVVQELKNYYSTHPEEIKLKFYYKKLGLIVGVFGVILILIKIY